MVFPWQDRAGRLVPLKLAVFVALFVPAIVVAILLANGEYGTKPFKWALQETGLWVEYGANPFKSALREIGLWGLRILFVSLAVTPLRRLLQWPRLLLVRRMIGVAAFAYLLTHLVLYAADESFNLAKVAQEIVLRFYLTIGFVALLGLLALAVTSTDAMVRRLGRNWQRLHRLAYPIAILGVIHYFLQTRANISQPLVMAGLLLWLLGWRLLAHYRADGSPPPWQVLMLGIVSGLATVVGDCLGWYLKVSVDPLRVLGAYFDGVTGIRPGHVVLAIGVVVVLLALWRMYATRRPARAPAR